MEGAFDFNKTPLALLGCPVLVHEAPTQRKSWDPLAVDAFYIGPAMDHYRCYKVYVSSNRWEQIASTIKFWLHHYQAPEFTKEEVVVEAIENLTSTIKQIPPTTTTTTLEALKNLAQIIDPTNKKVKEDTSK